MKNEKSFFILGAQLLNFRKFRLYSCKNNKLLPVY